MTIALVSDTIYRVQRSFKESVVLEDLRKEGKVEIHFIHEGLILKSNSADIMRWDMGVMFARSYVLQLSDNIKRSKEQSARNGIWMGLAPTGYMHTVNEKGDKIIVPDPEMAPFINKMFELYATGSYSLGKLRDELTELGSSNEKGTEVCYLAAQQNSQEAFILKGLITCTHCGCVVTPEIKKGRYVYHICTNGKGSYRRRDLHS